MNLKIRLALMNFLEFAVWGAYLTSMGRYLGNIGLGENIGWFYSMQGVVSIFMPAIMGIIADRWVQAQRLLGICHLLAGGFMIATAMYGASAGADSEFSVIFSLYAMSVAFYMPTLALTNSVAYNALTSAGMDTVKDFPPIRVFGTIGFILTMWFVDLMGFQMNQNQFITSGVLSIVLFLYCYTLPECKLEKKESKVSLVESLGLNAFKLFKTRQMALFFIFSALLGMCLQVTNGYAGPFITSFKGSADAAIATSFAANNATLLTSISQISEALCILLIPFFLKRFGIKVVMLMSMFAWVFRFGFFGVGNPAMPGVIMFILSCIVYGVAFDFFNVSGGIFVDQECEPSIKASAQGLFMMMTNGIGATFGTLAAGEIVNHYCQWENGFLQGDWTTCWFIFATFALIVGVSFALVFHPEKKS
jgi:NHS family nucleoside permease-like MFS transporter